MFPSIIYLKFYPKETSKFFQWAFFNTEDFKFSLSNPESYVLAHIVYTKNTRYHFFYLKSLFTVLAHKKNSRNFFYGNITYDL